MSKSFLNEAFDRKFGFKDISDEIETEELKRPKRKKYSEAAINEADYGGAYDIDPSQYFTRDDINEFAEQVVDAINTKSYSKVTLISSYIENNVIALKSTISEHLA